MTAWPGALGEGRHWRTQAGDRGCAGGRLAEDCRESSFHFCAWSRRWPLPSEQQTGLRGPGLRFLPPWGRDEEVLLKICFQSHLHRLSGPHFQKVPQLSEAVISTRKSVQQSMCILGPLILVRRPRASRRHLGLLPACRPFLVCVSPPAKHL